MENSSCKGGAKKGSVWILILNVTSLGKMLCVRVKKQTGSVTHY